MAETEAGLAALKRSYSYLPDSRPGCDDVLAMPGGCLNGSREQRRKIRFNGWADCAPEAIGVDWSRRSFLTPVKAVD